MYQERIREEAKLICQRHAAIGGVGPNDAKMAFLLKVQGSLSPSLIWNDYRDVRVRSAKLHQSRR